MTTKKKEFKIDYDDTPNGFAEKLEIFMRKHKGIRVIGFKDVTARTDPDYEKPYLYYELEYEK